MKPIKKILLSTLLASFAAVPHSFAQKIYPNSIKLYLGKFSVPDHRTFNSPLWQIGAGYERKVYKNWYASLGYRKWKIWSNIPIKKSPLITESHTSLQVGALESRINYNMTDLSAFYKRAVWKQRLFITGGMGVSYCWGTNSYLEWYMVNPEPPYDITGHYYTKDVHYWGVVPQIGGDFFLIKNRLSVGADIRGRFYIDRTPAQFDFELHAGVNF